MVKLTKKECEMLWRYVKKEYISAKYLEKSADSRLQKSYAKEATAWKALVDKIEAETGYSGEPGVSRTYFEVRLHDELIAYARTFGEAKACAEVHCRNIKGSYIANSDDIEILECECGNCVSVKGMNDE